MSNRLSPLAGIGLAVLLLSTAAAGAQDRNIRRVRIVHRAHPVFVAGPVAPPLTVRKRSFLDPGNVVEVGADNEYLTANTTEHRQIYTSFAPARFGESTLPGRFDLPDNPRFFPRPNIDFDFGVSP